MKLKVQRKIGDAILTVEVDERDDEISLAKILPFTEKNECGLCHSTDIVWHSQKGKGKDGSDFIYIRRRCKKCNATSTLSKYREGGLFWHQWQIYQTKDEKAPENEPKTNIPF